MEFIEPKGNVRRYRLKKMRTDIMFNKLTYLGDIKTFN